MVGLCRLCYRVRELTFEHIPPRSAFNRGGVRSVSLEEWVRHGGLDHPGGRIVQRGMGDRILCGPCNSFLGGWYVPEYREWAIWGLAVLARAPRAAAAVAATITGRRPLRFLKQCAAMLAATHDTPFLNIYPGLRKFVLDPEERRIPGPLDIYLTLCRGSKARTIAHAGRLDTVTGAVEVLGEVAFPPYGLLLTIGADRRQRFGRINALTQFGIDEVADVRLDLRIGEVVTPFPGDYRPREQVEREADASRQRRDPS